MSCNITITSAIGVGAPLQQIHVHGTAEDCPDSFEGGNLEVRLSCRAPDDPAARVMVVDTHPAGSWHAVFDQPFDGCACGGDVFISARCLTDEGCTASFTGELACDDCPEPFFGGENDVAVLKVNSRCDFDGTAIVRIEFNWSHNISAFLQARVNPGPGGTVLSLDSPFANGGSTVSVITEIRYDPAVTSDPAPFVEYVALADFRILNCPPLLIPVDTLPACPVSECPSSVTVEVTDENGNEVVVSGPNAVLCLLPGTYTVSVTAPAPDMVVFSYSWSINGIVVDPGQNGQPSLTIDVDAEDHLDVTVAVEKAGCFTPTGSAHLEACTLDCDVELQVEVRRAGDMSLVDASNCLPPGDYQIVVTAPQEPPWDFIWQQDASQPDTENTTSQYDVTLAAGQATTIKVQAHTRGCSDKEKDIVLSACIDDDPPRFGCGTLLLIAIGALVLGALLLVIGICLKEVVTTSIGASIFGSGALLLGIWFWLCRRRTGCDALIRARCALLWAGWTFVVLAFLMGFLADWTCGIAPVLSALGWFGIASLIEDLIAIRGCTPKSCVLPSSWL